MQNKFDKFILSIAMFLILFAINYYFISNIIFSIILTILIELSILLIYKIIKKHTNKYISKRDFINYLALQGNNYTLNLLYETIKNDNTSIKENYILINDTALFPMIKFGNVSMENIASVYHTCKENNLEKCNIIYSNIDKKIILFANSLDININFINVNLLYNYLKKHNTLPKIEQENHKKSANYKLLLENLLTVNTSKKLILLGTLFLLISLITPLKKYYIAMGSIVIIIAILPHLYKFIRTYIKNKN